MANKKITVTQALDHPDVVFIGIAVQNPEAPLPERIAVKRRMTRRECYDYMGEMWGNTDLAEFNAHTCTPQKGTLGSTDATDSGCLWWNCLGGRQCALRWERPDGSIPKKMADIIRGGFEWILADTETLTDGSTVEWVTAEGWRS